MARYNFKIVDADLSDERINKRKDYNRITTNYNKLLYTLPKYSFVKYKNRYIFIALVIALLLLLLLFAE
ncbi:MAG: hypothetical protein COC01_03800 [Bacteroidetes bacterium]|nr:MAG: hypothetical protein COC01_03800 [Bacteroidota bacterium]